MKTKTIVTLGVLGIFFVMIAFVVFGIFNFRNTSIKLNKSVDAQYVSNQSTYDSMWKKFKELTQVTDLQAEQMKDVYMSMISGRYEGDDNLLFKMVSENNPQMVDVYTTIQQQIAIDRNTFNNEQKKVIDKANQYNIYITKHFIYNTFFNFEERDLNDLIVTSDKTKDAFESKKDEELKLR